jgi:hypothetical protein
MDFVLLSKNNLRKKGGTLMKMRESKNTDLAGRVFATADYNRNDELSNGLAVTHEQASDSYTEGEAGGKIERPSGAKDELNNRGYQ